MKLRVAFFPDANALAGNPYWTILKNGMEAIGAEFISPDEQFLHWLWRTRKQPVILHLHYVQQYYAYENDYARFRWVLRLARNLWLARVWGHRVVFTLHNLTPTYPLKPTWVDHLGHRVAANFANAVIVHCQRARVLLAETYGRRKNVYVIPHPHFIGIYPDMTSRETARSLFGYRPDEVVLAFVGGIRPNKGLDRLVRVFKQCDAPLLRLLIAGKSGPQVEYTDAIRVAAAEDPRIRLYLGFITEEDMHRYYQAADAVILPFSRILTSSSTVLAMSFGRTVIVPRMGCLQELPDDVALQYEPENDSALLSVISRLSTADYSSLGANARQYIQQFTWENFAAATVDVYRNCHA